MSSVNILYFDKPGPANTEAVAKITAQRAAALDLRHIVLASNSGRTAKVFHRVIGDPRRRIVAVTSHAGFTKGDEVLMTPQKQQELEELGIRVVRATHALSGIERSVFKKFGTISHAEIIAHTLRRFGEGIKVCVEVAVMAADAGLAPTDREIIAVGGTGRGADAAVVMRAAHMNNFFDFKIHEILAKPR